MTDHMTVVELAELMGPGTATLLEKGLFVPLPSETARRVDVRSVTQRMLKAYFAASLLRGEQSLESPLLPGFSVPVSELLASDFWRYL